MRKMRFSTATRRMIGCGLACLAFGTGCSLVQAATTETLVFVRHGEKPLDVDNGQLTCQGFNRSIALAPVLLAKFGVPNYLFATAPEEKQDNDGNNYWYLRALSTIEPTAVAAGRTLNLKYAKNDIDDLENELMAPSYRSARVFVAWEHNELDELVANILHDNGGNSSVVPAWPQDDYDSIFVVTVVRDTTQTLATFTQDHEGLNNQDTLCPTGLSDGRPPLLLPPPVRPTPAADAGRQPRLR